MASPPLSPHEPRRLWSDEADDATAAVPTGDARRAAAAETPAPDRRPGAADRSRRTAPLMLLLVISALLGGGASVGVLAATGMIGDEVRTTVVRDSGSTATPVQDGSGGGLDAEALYAGASAGVVDIQVSGDAAAQQLSPFGEVPPQSQTTSSGTGFVVDDEGHIVTASHVVDDASSITVKFEDGTSREATLLGQDDATDVAVLKVDPAGLTLHPLPLGSSASLDVGDEVAAIGDPFGYERSISTGIVSGVDRTIEAPNGFTVAHAIQTDAAMNPGNSGGPVLNAAGEVVGIADQIATNGGAQQSSGVGFAVPIDLVKSALPTLQAGEQVSHAYLGIATGGSSSAAGAIVAGVTAGGPADAAGLRAGDVVTDLGGTSVTDANDLVAAIAGHAPGDEVQLTVRRGSETRQLTATLGTQPAQSGTGG